MQDRESFLSTERLKFSTWTESDQDKALQLWGDPMVSRYISNGGFSKEQIEARLQREVEAGRKLGLQYWPLFEKASNEFVGVTGIRPYELSKGVYELGFHLRPKHWGKGYASEAARAALDFARTTVQPAEMVAGHHPENLASRKLLLKLGFVYLEPHFYEPTGLMHLLYRLP